MQGEQCHYKCRESMPQGGTERGIIPRRGKMIANIGVVRSERRPRTCQIVYQVDFGRVVHSSSSLHHRPACRTALAPRHT